jgi:hypothetical protein
MMHEAVLGGVKVSGSSNQSSPFMIPDELESDAVVPQCLDNQYLTDDVYDRMMREGKDYNDDDVRRIRERAFNSEFMRSLIYSSQVVVQRAFFWNSDPLQRHFGTEPVNTPNFQSFARLMDQRAIVPFLATEKSLEEHPKYQVRPDAAPRIQSLLAEIGRHPDCVRLGRSDEANERANNLMTRRFAGGVVRMGILSDAEMKALAADLCVTRDATPVSPEDHGRFVESLRQLADLVQSAARGKDGVVPRNFIYEEAFCKREPNAVVNGFFLDRHEGMPYHFELKKLVDLVYNSNLPDLLHRYTFTPAGLPTRLALQDDAGTEYSYEEVRDTLTNEDLIASIQRTFMARTQEPKSLPFLADLSMRDAAEIRQLPEWSAFTAQQSGILRAPLDLHANIGGLQTAFEQFQNALSSWYQTKYGFARSTSRYCSYVSMGLSVAGRVIVAGSALGGPEKAMVGFGAEEVLRRIPDRVRRFAAKLLVHVYDIERREIDKARSYSIELMQADVELAKADVAKLMTEMRTDRNILPAAPSSSADQGIL